MSSIGLDMSFGNLGRTLHGIIMHSTCIIRRETRRQAWGTLLLSGQDLVMWRQQGKQKPGTTGGNSLCPTKQWMEPNDDEEPLITTSYFILF